jgi:hemerythrin-like domain-containing protein
MNQQASSDARADTRVLQAVHKTFRLATNRFIAATEKLEPSALQPIIGSRWRFYDAVLHEHHHNEDDGAFPALLAVRPDLGPLVKRLEDDHRHLIPLLQKVGASVTAFEHQPDASHQQAVHDGIVEVRDLFFPHLDTEDAQVIPAIAESIPPKEWDRLDQDALKAIPREHLATAIGALDEVIRGLPKAEQPPPPPPPIRFMLIVSWRRKWANWVKPLLVS